MDEEVDVYFAQHDIQSVVSDILYELGYHRPAEPGPFLAAYVARRFELPGGGGRGRGSSVGPVDYDAVQLLSGVHHPTAEELAVGQMLLEIRKLRRKYSRFVAEVRPDEEGQAAFLGIPWADFEADYERLLSLLGSSVLWAFAQRRLAAGRGIFEAHKALNQELEQEPEPEVRVDNCLQLARALPPGRLLELFRKLHEEPQLKELVKGRTPGCEELTADADAPAPGRNTLKGLFSCISAGGFLKETVLASLRLLERSSKATGGATFAEYRLPLLAEGDAWADLAEWHQELGSISERLAWVVQLPVSGYAALKGRRSILDYGELLSNAFGPPLKLAMEGPKEAQGAKLSELLERVVGFEVSCQSVTDLNGEDGEPQAWTEPRSPPFAYQLYHVWARLKGLNCARANAKQQELQLRAAAGTPEALACAYMLGAASVTGCAGLGSHATLQYLFMLDRVGVAVSLCSKRSLGAGGAEGGLVLSRLFQSGLRLTLCSEDPSVSHQGDDPLGEEYVLARSAGLSSTDLAELARTSAALSGFEARIGAAEEAEAGSRRARFRQARLREEMAFLTGLIPEKDQEDF